MRNFLNNITFSIQLANTVLWTLRTGKDFHPVISNQLNLKAGGERISKLQDIVFHIKYTYILWFFKITASILLNHYSITCNWEKSQHPAFALQVTVQRTTKGKM